MTATDMRARADREERIYGQKDLASMLRAGADAMEECERLKTDVRTYQDIVKDMTAEKEALAARLAEVEAAKREMAMQALADLGQAQEAYEAQRAAEAELSRLRTAQDAMVGAVIEEAAEKLDARASQLWDEMAGLWTGSALFKRKEQRRYECLIRRDEIRALRRDATASLQRVLREAENRGLDRAARLCRLRIMKNSPPTDQDQAVAIEEAEVIEAAILRMKEQPE